MPGRYLREGILTSHKVNSLDLQSELFYRRLISVVDDYGRFFADAAMLRSSVYPMKPEIKMTEITKWLDACQKAGLIGVYEIENVPYLVLWKLGEARNKKSKYPAPPEYLANASKCVQMLTDAKSTPEPDKKNAVDEVVDAWNNLGSPFPKVMNLGTRRKALLARLKDQWWSENWKRALDAIRISSFLAGKNDRGWVASFDFFVKPDSVAKILEGKYSGKITELKTYAATEQAEIWRP